MNEIDESGYDPQRAYRKTKIAIDTLLRDAILTRCQERDGYLAQAAETLSCLRPLAMQLNSRPFSQYTGYAYELAELERKVLNMRSKEWRESRRQ